jgi:hypothetical protein
MSNRALEGGVADAKQCLGNVFGMGWSEPDPIARLKKVGPVRQIDRLKGFRPSHNGSMIETTSRGVTWTRSRSQS